MTYKYFEFLIEHQKRLDEFTNAYKKLTKCELYDFPLVDAVNNLIYKAIYEDLKEVCGDLVFYYLYEQEFLPEELQDCTVMKLYNYIIKLENEESEN